MAKSKKKKKEPSLLLHKATITLYFLIWTLLALYFLITTWPTDGAGNEQEKIEYFHGLITISASFETRIIILVLLTGALGSCIYLGRAFILHVSRKNDFDKKYMWWYLFRPFIGSVLALIVYFVLRGALIAAPVTEGDVNLYGLMAFSGLVGMFSNEAVERLHEIFKQIFQSDRK